MRRVSCLPPFSKVSTSVPVTRPSQLPIAFHLFFRIHGGHGVFQILNRSHGGFDQQVIDMRGIILADVVRWINLDLDMQTVVLEQDTRRRIASCRYSRQTEQAFFRPTFGAAHSG
jgi:hypothetical protein